MTISYGEFKRIINELESEVDKDTIVSFVDEYGDTYPVQSVITVEKNGKLDLVIE